MSCLLSIVAGLLALYGISSTFIMNDPAVAEPSLF
jgi:hypothetical protein